MMKKKKTCIKQRVGLLNLKPTRLHARQVGTRLQSGVVSNAITTTQLG